MSFEEWMKAEGLSSSSISKYVGAINGRLSTWANHHGISSQPLDNIFDTSTFDGIAEKIKRTPEYIAANSKGHHMYGAALANFRQYLTAAENRVHCEIEYGPHREALQELTDALGNGFIPNDQADARKRVLRQIVARSGQRKFRDDLIEAYNSRCAITGCTVLPLLEAAHITPYLGPQTNHITNGLLLRADIHTLWDLGLIAVNPQTFEVRVSAKISDETYKSLSGKLLSLPRKFIARPSVNALESQWNQAID